MSLLTPKYKHLKSAQSKDLCKISPKAVLQNLQKEVERSRIAYENITNSAEVENQYRGKIDGVQGQLQSCITNINIEGKKQKVLSELIGVLKGEMFNYQITKKKEEEAEETKKQKLTKKIQYEIDQILQKHNEEVAKIQQLKELSNSRRSERVVYSNLFKKLEKEIKYYEEIYKNQLIKSETTREKEPLRSENRIYIDKDGKKQVNVEELVKKNYEERYESTLNNTCEGWNGFLTNTANKQVVSNEMYSKKFQHIDSLEREENRSSTFYREQRTMNTKETMKKIAECTNLLDKLKIHTECSNAEQIFERYAHLDEDNEQLISKIRKCDHQIEKYENESNQLNQEVGQYEFSKKYSILASEMSEEELIALREIQEEKRKREQEMSVSLKILCSLGEELNVKLEESDLRNFSTALPEDEIRLLDKKISYLINFFTKGEPIYSSTLTNREDTLISQVIVDTLLEKMEKFGNCERILDRELFQQEYYKEITKRRPIKSRK